MKDRRTLPSAETPKLLPVEITPTVGSQTQLEADPFSGQVLVFRSLRGDRIKLLRWCGDGFCLFAKRLERGRFV